MAKDTVGVFIRLRPLKLEDPTILKKDEQQVQTNPPDGSPPQVYSFTQVFNNASQTEIFRKVAEPVVKKFIVNQKDGLIFTYGITGSGKTYTMEGTVQDPGLIYRTIDFVFNSIGSQQTKRSIIASDSRNGYLVQDEHKIYPELGRNGVPLPSVIKWQNRMKERSSVEVDSTTYFCVFVSLIELYGKQVHDLLEDLDTDKKRREIRTDNSGISYVANAVEAEVKSADEAVELYTRGIKRRKTGCTILNNDSSRGHCVLNLKLVQVRKSIYGDNFDESTLVSSQLCLVDLAGSERTKRTGATGEALQEACNINKSLGALRKCIRALRERKPTNVQYRDYTITRLFKSYFEGHGSVRMVLCVKPSPDDFAENNIAMEFGLLTQDVAIDYASPRKKAKGRPMDITNYAAMFELNTDVTDDQFIMNWITKLKSNYERRKRSYETFIAKHNAVRENIEFNMKENAALRNNYETREKDRRIREMHFSSKSPALLEDAPSAPLQSSSPINIPEPSSTETTESESPQPTTNSSSEATDYHQPTGSPTLKGQPVVNPRYEPTLCKRSGSWLHHQPERTLSKGTIMSVKPKSGKVVKNLRREDILNKDAAGYSVVHQDANKNGDVENSIYKGKIIPTITKGVQVVFDDIEVMRQISPKRKRVSTDARYTH